MASKVNRNCLGCGTAVNILYMLNDTLWRRLVAESDRDRELCWDCLSARMGRAPRYGDFRITPIEHRCVINLTSMEGHDAWKAVFPKFPKRMKHRLFQKLVKGAMSEAEFEQRLISYARSTGVLTPDDAR